MLQDLDAIPPGPTEAPAELVFVCPPAGTALDRPCDGCCRWESPILATHMQRVTPHAVALLFDEWIVWHLHEVLHQRGGLLS